ncbi:MAG: hypothetical protein AAGA54_27640 [Myxococcota bacterium]
MDAQRLHGLVFLLSVAGLAMPGCDPAEGAPEDGEAPEEEGAPPTGSVCERHAANYVECYPDGPSLEETIAGCGERIEYLADISQECADTYVVLADCLSKLECAELSRGCVEETIAHGSLVCMGGFSTGE